MIKGVKKFIKDNGVVLIVEFGNNFNCELVCVVDSVDVEIKLQVVCKIGLGFCFNCEIKDVIQDFEGVWVKLKFVLNFKF